MAMVLLCPDSIKFTGNYIDNHRTGSLAMGVAFPIGENDGPAEWRNSGYPKAQKEATSLSNKQSYSKQALCFPRCRCDGMHTAAYKSPGVGDPKHRITMAHPKFSKIRHSLSSGHRIWLGSACSLYSNGPEFLRGMGLPATAILVLQRRSVTCHVLWQKPT